MGCFDTIFVPCPDCGQKEEAQTKAGDCSMKIYKLEDAPPIILSGVNDWAPFTCANCGCKFMIDFKIIVTKRESVRWKDDENS